MRKIICFAFLLILTGCATRREITYNASRDTVYITKQDWLRDSVFVDRWRTITTKGDTVYKTDSVTLLRYCDRLKVDTIYKSHADTCYIEKTTTQPASAKKAGAFYIWYFWISAVLIVIYIAWRIVKAVYFRK